MNKLIWMGSSREDLRAFPRQARREMGYQLENVQEGSGDSRPGIFGRLSLYLSRDAAGRNLCLALLPKEDAEDKPTGSGFGGKTI